MKQQAERVYQLKIVLNGVKLPIWRRVLPQIQILPTCTQSFSMWVGENEEQWTEPFRAIVTDKTVTKQGVWFVVSVGDSKAEAELWPTLGVSRRAEQAVQLDCA